jgi:hypothetical protein
MEWLQWLDAAGHAWIQSLGIMGGLGFTALGFRAEAKSRQSENLIRITESHRELWTRYDESPALHRVLDPAANVDREPVTAEEARFVQFLILHIHLTYQLSKGGVYHQPERVREDIRGLISLPVPHAVWRKLCSFQNRDFVKFIDSCLM